MTINATRLGAIVSVALCAVAFFFTSKYPSDAALFPEMLLVFMAVLSLVLYVRSYRVDAYKAQLVIKRPKQLAACAALIVVYAAAASLIGYYIASALFILALVFFLRFQNKIVPVIVAVAFPAVVFLVFEKLLHIPVPSIGF